MFAIWETPTNIRVPGKTNAKHKYIVYRQKGGNGQMRTNDFRSSALSSIVEGGDLQ